MMKKIALLFTVTALAGGSLAAVEQVPCSISINSQEAFDEWVSIDANNDGSPYEFVFSENKGCALYTQNKSGAANDWMISPAVTLEAGVSYTVTFSVQNMSSLSFDKQDFNLCAGAAPEVAAMTKFASFTGETKTTWPVDRSGEFTPSVSGNYYFGLNLTSKSFNGDFGVFGLTVAKAPVIPGTVTDLKVEAAPKGAKEAILTWTWPETSKAGGKLSSITGAKIYRGTGPYSTSVIETIKINATPGSEGMFVDTSVPSSDSYYYKIQVFNEDGEGNASTSVKSPFIGMATSVTITNAVAAPVAGDDSSVALTWNGPTAGEGYFDPAEVAYKITRSKDGATAVTLEESWQGELPYVDPTIDGLGSYVYTIYTIFGGTTAWSGVKSNAVIAGGSLALPYSNDFSSAQSIALFTIFHGPDGTRDWGVLSSALNYWGGSTADAWAVTPKFKLEAGKAYKVSFTARVSSASSPKNLAVTVGSEPTAEAQSDVIFTESIASGIATAKEALFSVPASGDYCVGFHCFGASDSNDLYVDNLTIEEVATAPLGVTDAKAEAAAQGELKVAVSWVNPSATTAGGELPVVDKVVVSLDGTEVAVESNVEGGSASSVLIDVETPGVYTCAITAYMGDNASETVEVTSGWVGFDTPEAPGSVTVTVGDDGERVVEFAAVTEGVHGGYVDVDNLRYEVSRNDRVLTSDQTVSPYVDSDEITELGVYTYSVAAINGNETGAATSAAPVTLGDALPLPYEPAFDSADSFVLWTLNGWKYDKTSNGETGLMNGSNNSCMSTPPLKMQKGVCRVTIKGASYNSRYAEDLQVYLAATAGASLPEADAVKVGDAHFDSPWSAEHSFEYEVPADGTYYITLSQEKRAMFFYLTSLKVEQVSVDPTLGIDEVAAGSGDDAVYFDLYGRRVARPAAGSVVIVSRNGKTTKEVYHSK